MSDSAYWAVAALLAGLLIVPWHLWQFALHGHPFLHDYVGVNLTGRLFQAFEGNAGSPLDYVDILRRGFSIWGYVWPLAYLWAVWRAIARGDRRMKLLLVWITLPLLLFSVAQTKLGWYISMIYPAIALLLGLALVRAVHRALGARRGGCRHVAFVACACQHPPMAPKMSSSLPCKRRSRSSLASPSTCLKRSVPPTHGRLPPTRRPLRSRVSAPHYGSTWTGR